MIVIVCGVEGGEKGRGVFFMDCFSESGLSLLSLLFLFLIPLCAKVNYRGKIP